MLKKISLMVFVCIFSLGFAQKKKKSTSKAVAEKEIVIIYTEEEAETASEPRIIAGFLKQNPGHPKSDQLKRKLMNIIMADNSPAAKPVIKKLSKDKIESIVGSSDPGNSRTLASTGSKKAAGSGKSTAKSGPSAEGKRTADMLTHLFNNDPNNREAYVNIKNASKCRLVVKISGKKYYNLDVPANGQNFVLIEKGEYVLTTMVCDAKYSSLKKINKDIEIQLSIPD